MGDPKRFTKKYATPRHPWVKHEIEQTRELKREYGLKNRQEILIATSFLKKYKDIAKSLTASRTAQSEKEAKQVLDKMHRLGFLQAGAQLDQILALTLKEVLERRLQSVVYRKGLARTMKQARQFITHRHIAVDDKEITSPAYLVSVEEEAKLGFKGKSTLASEDHPERVNHAEEIKKEVEAVKSIEEKNEEEALSEEEIKEGEAEIEA